MGKLDYSCIKRFIREIYRMSIKGISVTNETIDPELVSEINHFMALLISRDKRFKPEFDKR